ncbi:Cof-type HAD-IIB family hydrolase [Pseudobutyrivibrio sp. MD2005]|uniref:Cof-type HAD-IIB family hydrolase n=1 Tax=Pseudobutyrivibrio sp. MD2005 TaxID=1410616 RepID=UPI000487F049|nr:Cof-type HAD-IIB family hydrolase [Pseudobutyrivibrio sp. MD2005]
MSKLIFFDIDGTLISFDGELPQSTIRALKNAQARGHKIFICTGRSKCQIEDRLLDIGFDGIVAASGAYTEYHGKVVNAEYMEPERLKKLLTFFDKNNIVYMLQCSDKVVATTKSLTAMKEIFKEKLKNKPKSIDKIFAKQHEDDDLSSHFDTYTNAEKACYYLSPLSLDEVEHSLNDDFDVTAMSFKDSNDSSGEICMKDITKAYGMKKIIDYLDSSVEDTIAFGDGPNDFEMIEFANIGVAMGNASPALKEKANMITSKITDDGIYNGMKNLGLIG